MENKVKRVALQTIILRRDGEQFVPKIGDVVELTPDELAQITEVNPSALGKIEINKSVARAVVEQAVDMDAIKAEALAQARKELEAEMKAGNKDKPTSTVKKAQEKAKTDAKDDDI
ncbi:hypothetical protein JT321_gp29 [Providencia phage Kokobel1]|uniref:DUF7443 domain-containing protein n=1 Tax=Providencia phage Kokobel1 TaxID=2783540 RepID=A0A873WJB3_9CAUD|nr:hypothetical protein JT321_gp29 [Providencia phage Kokobel1]QPB11456.1 hypothetical protein [Providencia phage Kokobel1]